ncbi:MAG: SpoIID/LytB domain-containing protein [Nitrospinae bacterium]|nr:SpoIID/LytB domain-containing protein [Nitrospinota bacterium]
MSFNTAIAGATCRGVRIKLAPRLTFCALFAFAAFSTPGAHAKTIRVAVEKGLSSVTVHSEWPIKFMLGSENVILKTEGGTARVAVKPGGFSIGGRLARDNEVTATSSGPIRVGSLRFHGEIQFVKDGHGRMMVVNHVDLEEYVAGVVAREMGGSWPEEALKAQAIAARTFALYQMERSGGRAYDLDNTYNSQVYGGQKGVNQAVKEAVFATRGIIARYDGQTAGTFYHSSAGGRTEDLKEVWGGERRPYLVSRPALFEDRSPHRSWRRAIGAKEVAARLGRLGVRGGPVTAIDAISHTESGRVRRAKISLGSGKKIIVSGETLRRILGETRILSTKFEVRRSKKGAFVFSGEGFGHGVGMSQWSARGMSENGATYDEIVQHFYPGVELTQIYEELQLAQLQEPAQAAGPEAVVPEDPASAPIAVVESPSPETQSAGSQAR